MSRKTAREVAMKLAFSRLLGGENTYQAVLDQSGIEEEPSQSDLQFADTLFNGVQEHIDEIDAYVERFAIGWKIKRMAKVDLSILRVAIFEMLYCDEIPHSVSINEAVELSKQFGGERSSAYVNGILGAVEKEIGEG